MARRSNASDGWELVGGLIGLGVVVGAAYVLDQRRQEIVDQLIAAPFDEAREALGALVPMLDDNNWAGVHSILASRATQSGRARRLLDIARVIRGMTPHVLQLLRRSHNEQINAVIELAQDLDDEPWEIFDLTMAGFAKRDDDAATLMEIARETRHAATTVKALLTYRQTKAIALTVRHTLDLDEREGKLFLLMLKLSAEKSILAEKLYETAERTQELWATAKHLASLSVSSATVAMIELTQRLDDSGKELFRHILDLKANHHTTIVQLRETYRRLPEAISLVDRLISQAPETAIRSLAAKYVAAPEQEFPWAIVRMFLLKRGHNSENARALLARAQRYHEVQPTLNRLLAAPPAMAQQELLTSSIGADAEDAIAELFDAYGPANPAVEPLTVALRTVRDQRSVLIRDRIRSALEDGVITPAEQSEIDALSDRFNVSPQIASQIAREIHEEIERATTAREQIRSHIELALADGEVTPAELAAIHALRERLHIKHAIVEQIFAEIQSTQNTEAQPQVPWLAPDEIAPIEAPADRFRNGLREALADQVMTKVEAIELEQLRRHLNLSADLARQIYLEVQAEAQP